ncbi:Killer protein [Paraburkholderia sacchari]|uniref:killer protein n=1 Tax=Paraburkholderia sacchari TaxID=159450 RepID=UPI0039A7181C
MKRRSMAAALCITALAGAIAPQTALAEDNENACGAVLCLAGLILGGSGGKSCAEYEANYFSIVRFHNGHFDLSGTANARTDFTNQCQSVGSDVKGPVNSKYGAVQNGP